MKQLFSKRRSGRAGWPGGRKVADPHLSEFNKRSAWKTLLESELCLSACQLSLLSTDPRLGRVLNFWP